MNKHTIVMKRNALTIVAAIVVVSALAQATPAAHPRAREDSMRTVFDVDGNPEGQGCAETVGIRFDRED